MWARYLPAVPNLMERVLTHSKDSLRYLLILARPLAGTSSAGVAGSGALHVLFPIMGFVV